jgi:hypothetical protein
VAIEQHLLNRLSGAMPATMDQVIDRMKQIDDLLPDSDGLKWFNRLYLTVTDAVRNEAPIVWRRPEWLTTLDVDFANFYFDAVRGHLNGQGIVPKAWKALFEARQRREIDPIQFAIAGMNAHINHDLALTLLKVNAKFAITPAEASPEHDDFTRVNVILNKLLPVALSHLDDGDLGRLAEKTGKIGRILAMWNVKAAREFAWDFGSHLRDLHAIKRLAAVTIQDRLTGALGRSLLLAV